MFLFVANWNQSRNIWLTVVANANIFFRYLCWTDLKSPVGCLANRRWRTHTQYCNNDRPSKAINMSCHKLQCKRECKSIHYVLWAAVAAAKCMFDRLKMLCYYPVKCLCSFDAFIYYVHIQSSTWQLKTHANIRAEKNVCKQTIL